MKYILYFSLFSCGILWSQEKNSIAPHLENRNELRIGTYVSNYVSSTEVSYELQTSDHFSLGISGTFSLIPDEDYYYTEEDQENKFSIQTNGRYYLKDYITHSFLYLFFDDRIKVRYFVEGAIGYTHFTRTATYRYLDYNNHYIINRRKKKEHNATTTLGFGMKLLSNSKFSFDTSFGVGNYYFNDLINPSFGYFKMGIGYRF